MNKEMLDRMKQDYDDMDRISRGDFLAIEELEQNPASLRYKKLLDIKKYFYGEDDYYREAHVIGEIISNYSNGLILETNNIWVWFLDMPIRTYEEWFKTTIDECDKDKFIAVYIDLENSKE